MPFQQSMFDSKAAFRRPPLVGVVGAGNPPFKKSVLLAAVVLPAAVAPPLPVLVELELDDPPHAATRAATPTTSIVGTSFFLMTLLQLWSRAVDRSAWPS